MTSTARLTSRRPRVVHEHNWLGGLLWVLAAVLALGWLDSMDNAAFWQEEALRAQAENERRTALESLPNPAIVLDAASAEKFGLRIAEIAGGLDGERARMRK
jgi:hypothetical protein